MIKYFLRASYNMRRMTMIDRVQEYLVMFGRISVEDMKYITGTKNVGHIIYSLRKRKWLIETEYCLNKNNIWYAGFYSLKTY